LTFSGLRTPPSRLREDFPRRNEAPQAVFPAAVTAIEIRMTPFGCSTEGRSDRGFIGVDIDT
jgi:hypothetical protein